MIQYEEYKTVDILSEAQAFMQLKKGNVKQGYLKYLYKSREVFYIVKTFSWTIVCLARHNHLIFRLLY